MSTNSRTTSAGAYEAELAGMPQSGAAGFFFPFDKTIGGYSDASYNASYSDSKISAKEVAALLADVNALPDTRMPSYKPYAIAMVLWPISLFVSVFILNMNVKVETYVCDGPRGPCHMETSGSIEKNKIGQYVAVAVGVHLWIFIVTLLLLYKKLKGWKLRRAYSIQQVINCHLDTTLRNKNIFISLSKHESYISIIFLWKPQPPQQDPPSNDPQYLQQAQLPHQTHNNTIDVSDAYTNMNNL